MYEGILGIIYNVCVVLSVVAPFSFVFCLIYAIRDAVRDGDRDIAFGLGAAVSLLVMVVACMM